MTLRRILIASSLAAALSVGALAVPAAQAAPVTTPAGIGSAAPASYTALGRDPLAAYADAAVNAWLRYSATRSSQGLADYNQLRDALATEAARRVGADEATMVAAWRAADTDHQMVLMTAMTQLGTPYRRNGRSPGTAFDCSGFTSWAWAQTGVALPRSSRDQIRHITAVSQEDAQAGDLAYYPGHIMIYLGVENFILHAPFTGRSVEFSHIAKSKVKYTRFGDPLA